MLEFCPDLMHLKGLVMFSMFDRLDLFLLDRVFNPLALSIFKQFGVSNFSVSKVIIMLGTAFLFLTVYKLMIGTPFDHNPIIFGLLCILEFAWATFGLRSAIIHEAKWRNPKPGQLPENLRDSPRVEVTGRRFFLMLTLLIGTATTIEALAYTDHGLYIVRNVGWILILIGLYFLGCTPPGPRERLEREEKTRLSFASSN